MARLGATTRILAAVRQSEDPPAMALARDVEAHCRRLRRLGLRPADLTTDVGLATSAGWAARRVPLVMPLAAAVAIAGLLLFWVPYRLTGILLRSRRALVDSLRAAQRNLGIRLNALYLNFAAP